MKSIIKNYSFVTATKVITLTDVATVRLDRLALITDVTTNKILYNFADLSVATATVSTNTITLSALQGGEAGTDKLRIDYDADQNDAAFGDSIISVSNVSAPFRDGFDVSTGLAPDTSIWTVSNPDGHSITLGGNSFGASYLRISMNPLLVDSEVTLTSNQSWSPSLRGGYGLTMSQRLIGQEVFAGLVGTTDGTTIDTTTQVADSAITGSTASITSNVATFTLTNHGLNGGDRIIIRSCADERMNVGPVVVAIVDKDNFNVPLVIANGTYSTVSGYVVFCDPLKYLTGVASNGFGILYGDSVGATVDAWVMRRNGDKFRSTAATLSTTIAAQSSTSSYTDAFNSSNINDLLFRDEEIKYHSQANDGLGTLAGILKYQQTVPDKTKKYKWLFRVRNLPNMVVPVARITAIAKTGTTTATVTTDAAHGLVTGDLVQITGVRDQTNFPYLAAATAVTVTDGTHFTIVIGTATSTSSLDGTVYKNVGSVLAPSLTQAVQSVACLSNGILTVTGSAAWATPLPGEYMHLHGLTAAASAYEGAYKVLRASTTTLELAAPAMTTFGSITTGGTLIRRTDVRLHFVRMQPWERIQAEVTPSTLGNSTDINGALPVAITSPAAAQQSTGASGVIWNTAGPAGLLVNDVVSAALTTTTTTAAISPGIVLGIGNYSHSFNCVVTAVAGTLPTLDIGIDESPDNGTNWIRIWDMPRITVAGTYVTPKLPCVWGTRYRYVQTITGSAGQSFTRAINRLQFSDHAPIVRQFIDRSITVTSLSSVTPTYTAMGTNNLILGIKIGATTIAPQIQLQGSDDNTTTGWMNVGTILTAVASSYVALPAQAFNFQYVRAIITTAGTVTTADYVLIKAMEQ